MLPPKLPDLCGPLGLGRPSNSYATYGHIHEESRKIISAKEGASPGEKCQMSGVVSPLGRAFEELDNFII